jgi:hypothetical protein
LRGKLLLPLLLALGLLAGGVGLLTGQALCPVSLARAGGGQELAPAGAGAQPAAGGAEAGKRVVAGEVRGMDGKPLAGARVGVIGWSAKAHRGRVGYHRYETLASARTDASGRFRLELPADAVVHPWSLQLLAAAPGHGLGWRSLPEHGGTEGIVLSLGPEGAVRGRLLDLQGEPVKQATLQVVRVESPDRRQAVPQVDAGFHEPLRGLPGWPGPVTTDAQGRFTVPGLGKGVAVKLVVTDPRFARQSVTLQPAGRGEGKEAAHLLLPPQVLEGTVVGEDSGKPVGKVLLHVSAQPERADTKLWEQVQGWTDERGRFRLPCPPGRLAVSAYPADGSPYLSRTERVTWPRGAVRHQVRITLPRGVRLRGKVTESPSGKPVAGAVVGYVPYATNPFAHFTILSWRVGGSEWVRTEADGTFTATVLPGEGHVLARGATRDYVLRRVDTAELHSGNKGGRPCAVPALERLNLKPGAEAPEVRLTLQRGVTLRGRLLDPDGKPVKRALLVYPFRTSSFWADVVSLDYGPEPVRVEGGKFEVPGCAPGKELLAYFLDAENRWGAKVRLAVKEKGAEVTVRLQPCGSARLRVVDPKGKPRPRGRASLDLVLDGDFPVPLSHRALAPQGVPLADKDGWVTVPALIPGARYRTYRGNGEHTDFVPEAGKTQTLPERGAAKPAR